MCIWLEVNSFKRSTSTPSNNRELPTIRTEVGWPGVAGCILTASDRKSTRLNSSHSQISYAVFCLKKKNFKLELAPQNLPPTGNLKQVFIHCNAERAHYVSWIYVLTDTTKIYMDADGGFQPLHLAS